MKKATITISLLLYFLIGYYLIGLMPRAFTIDGRIFVDYLIPIIPFFAIFYYIGYVFVAAPLFMSNEKEFKEYALYIFLILTTSFFLFLIPIEMPKEYLLGSDLFSKMISLSWLIDHDFNNFPSLHVSLSMFSYLFITEKKDWLAAMLFPFAFIIVISTMMVKQHLFIDILGGLGIAFGFYYLYKKRKR